MTTLILHGISGHAGIYWQQSLRDDLVKLGHKVIMPTLPKSDNPDRNEWIHFTTDLLRNVDHSSLIIVGHSLGVPAALDYIEQANSPIKALVSVSGFARPYGLELNQKYLESKVINFDKFIQNVQEVHIYYGDDDPYVPIAETDYLADVFRVSPKIYRQGGHFNSESGFDTFPELTRLIKELSMSEHEFIDKLAYVHLKDKRVLMTMSKGKDTWYIPGGKRDEGETDYEALVREMKEETTVDIIPETIRYHGSFTAQAHGKPKGVLVRMTCYTGEFEGELRPNEEIERVDYKGSEIYESLAPVDKLIFDDLKNRNLIK